jgi:hypothetical protein
MGCHDDCQDVVQTLIGHVAQDIFDIGWPVPHAHIYWQLHPTFVQEPFDGGGLLYGQCVKWRKAPQLPVVGGDFCHACVCRRTAADNTLDETQGFTARAGNKATAASGCRTAKGDK